MCFLELVGVVGCVSLFFVELRVLWVDVYTVLMVNCIDEGWLPVSMNWWLLWAVCP